MMVGYMKLCLRETNKFCYVSVFSKLVFLSLKYNYCCAVAIKQ